ncbi:MAG: hypothetical protein VW362_12560 [Candidatus Nanopelagicales bacterium]
MTSPDQSSTGDQSGPTRPEDMRAAMAAYVQGLHQSYLDAADLLTPGDRARMPLIAEGQLTVAAVGTRVLHVIGTTESLGPARGPEVALSDELPGLTWTVRFFDPVIIPALGLVDEAGGPAFDDVRRHLGLATVLYHLAVPPGSTLTPHHAAHAGTGLAHSHATAVRDFDALRAYAPGSEAIVDEMQGAHLAGLRRAHLVLAQRLCPELAEIPLEPAPEFDGVRRRAIEALRPRSGGRS